MSDLTCASWACPAPSWKAARDPSSCSLQGAFRAGRGILHSPPL